MAGSGGIMQSEISQIQKDQSYLHVESKIVNLIKAEVEW